MPKTLDPNAIASKWNQRASAAAPAYTTGVNNPRVDYATATTAAEGTWEQGVTSAIGRKAFSAGVKRAGTQKWQAAAAGKGSQRYPGGVAAGQPNYQSGVTPYLQVLSTLSLPLRGPKGAANNLQRVSAVDTALNNKKMSIQGGSTP